ncbi:MAG: HEAT repeat domain-containing protein [Candidatus Promineifilaceae bacterium]
MSQSITELIDALASISPMPDDDSPDMTLERVRAYESLLASVEDLIDAAPSEMAPRMIDAVLGSFGPGLGFELYWTALFVLEKFPLKDLRPRLHQALRSGRPGVRKWSAYMLGRQRNKDDTPVLIAALSDPEPIVRSEALIALTMIGDISALPAVQRLRDDPSEDVRKMASRAELDIREQRFVFPN